MPRTVNLTRMSPGLVGAFIGGLFGFLWVLFDWKIFLIFLFMLIGYFIGKLLESEELRDKLRDLFEAISR